MLKIGLTGGIGCGKTTVSNLFSALHVPIIDADDIAHDLVKPGSYALIEIIKVFGNDYLLPDGQLNRTKLRELIFTNTHAKQQLETIIHPLIFKEIKAKLQRLNHAYCIISIPLLFETNMAIIADRILVVDCLEEQQIERVQKRTTMNIEQIQAIINSQIARDIRLSKADDVINNTGMESSLIDQVKTLHNMYISLSAF